MSERSTLVGGGLAGSMLALYLARRGHHVTVYESRPDLRIEHLDAGRSINLALAARGIAALTEVGVMDQVEPLLLPMRGRMIHDLDGATSLQPYGIRPEEVIYSVSRPALTALLLDAAEATGQVTTHFDQRCVGGDLDAGVLRLRDYRTEDEYEVEFDTVYGTDGSSSAVRDLIAEAEGGSVEIDPLDHSYKELTMPAGTDGSFLIDPGALHIWPRSDYMLIALPNLDGTFTCTLFLASEGEPSFARLTAPADVEAFFTEQFADFVDVTPDFVDQFFENPTGRLATVRCDNWAYRDRAVILGDAAHAIVPFHGQGMNAAFESCDRLDEWLDLPDRAEAFQRFQETRKPNTDAIAQMALDNYVQMRSSVIDDHYLLKRAVALELERRWPDRFVPRYSMVMFHTLPYAEALERARRQDDILERLVAHRDHVEQVDWDEADRLLDTLPAFTAG